jgi:tripartite-type tricarboxylate transporter receptor subunit TctC
MLAKLALAALLLAALPAVAQSDAEFFRGKTVTIHIGGTPGTSFDLDARVLAAHMARHWPGEPTIVVQSVTGAGGTRAAAFVANAAPKDGTAIGLTLPSAVIAPALRPSLKYDSAQLVWIGALAPLPGVISVWHTAPAKTVEEAKRAELIVGASGKLSEAHLAPALLNAIAGTKFKFVLGYPGGGPMNLAMEKGEIHGRFNYWNGWVSTKPDWLREKKIIHLVQYGPPIPDLPDVPSLTSFARDDSDRALIRFIETASHIGRAFFAPPGLSPERTAMLRRTFDATMRDPEFLKETAQRNIEVKPTTGAELQAVVARGVGVSPATIDRFKELVDISE